jgi:hypothetical protein
MNVQLNRLELSARAMDRKPLPPTTTPKFPIPPLHCYTYLPNNHKISKYSITISPRAVISRLKQAGTANAVEKGHFPDTGLPGTSETDIDELKYFILILTEGLFEGKNTTTFGVLGCEDGVWRVLCWVQPTDVSREVEKMVKEGLLGLGKVVKKERGWREGLGGRDIDGETSSIGEHEWIWEFVREWDEGNRKAWRRKFV